MVKRGDKVTYIPWWACGDREHADVEYGVVHSVNNTEGSAKVVFPRINFPQSCWLRDLHK